MTTIYLDTETTGLRLDDGAALVEVAVVDDDGAVLLNTLVNPGRSIPSAASELEREIDDGWALAFADMIAADIAAQKRAKRSVAAIDARRLPRLRQAVEGLRPMLRAAGPTADEILAGAVIPAERETIAAVARRTGSWEVERRGWYSSMVNSCIFCPSTLSAAPPRAHASFECIVECTTMAHISSHTRELPPCPPPPIAKTIRCPCACPTPILLLLIGRRSCVGGRGRISCARPQCVQPRTR